MFILDPRFKHKFSIDDECVKEVMSEMVLGVSRESQESPPVPISESDEPPCKKGKFSKLFGTSFPNLASDPLSDEERKIDMYMQHPSLDIDEPALTWWKQEATCIPLLSIVARKYLSVCATSVPSERVFSMGGNVVSSKRTMGICYLWTATTDNGFKTSHISMPGQYLCNW